MLNTESVLQPVLQPVSKNTAKIHVQIVDAERAVKKLRTESLTEAERSECYAQIELSLIIAEHKLLRIGELEKALSKCRKQTSFSNSDISELQSQLDDARETINTLESMIVFAKTA